MRPSPTELIAGRSAELELAHRRATGAHYTGADLAALLVDIAAGHLGYTPRVVCDPSCGAGSFLIAAADKLLESGVSPQEIISERLWGFDIDADTVAAAREVLQQWARENWPHPTDGDPAGSVITTPEQLRPNVFVADALTDDLAAHFGSSGVDLVVGNPPFLSQLAADTAMSAERRDLVAQKIDLSAAYTDASALHMLAAVRLAGRDSVVCLLQPQSVLGARDSGPVRAAIVDVGRIVGLWASDEEHFDAHVRVCAPVIRTDSAGDQENGAGNARFEKSVGHIGVSLYWNGPNALATPVSSVGEDWAPLLAACMGVPTPTLSRTGATTSPVLVVGDVAVVTAGFRDEFYAIAAATAECATEDTAESQAKVVTSGMIDPGVLRWGEAEFRIGGKKYRRPVLDWEELCEASPRIERWARSRMVGKVLVATQTKVMEAVCDSGGNLVPITPVVSVEPSVSTTSAAAESRQVTPEMLSAAFAAPVVSSWIARRLAGTGRSTQAFRVSASEIAKIPLPDDLERWRELSLRWQSACTESPDRRDDVDLARQLDQLYGVRDESVIRWWLSRLPKRRMKS